MRNKILITGGAGFIGSHLVEFLIKQEIPAQKIRLLIPRNESLENLPQSDFDILRGDIQNKEDVKIATEGVDVIYHLAALTIDGGKYFTQEEYTKVNVQGTKNLLHACKNKKIKKFIFFSSIAVYGLPAWAGDIENWDETRLKNPREIYGESKLQAEYKVEEAHKKWRIPYVIIRPTSVYGPRDKRNLLELYKAIAKHLFFYIGSGKNKMDYVYVKDVVRAAYLAAESKHVANDYIIGCGKPLTLREVVSNVAKSIHTSVPSLYIPKNFAYVMSFGIEKISQLLGIRPMLFPARVKVMTSDCYFSIDKAKRDLKYTPQYSFEEGTSLTGKWLLENKLL